MRKFFSAQELSLVPLVILTGVVSGLIAAGVINAQHALLVAVVPIACMVFFRHVEFGIAVVVFAIYLNLSDVLIEHHGLPSVALFYVPFMSALIGLEWFGYKKTPWFPRTGLMVLGIYALVLVLSFFYAADHDRVAEGFMDLVKNAMIAITLAVLISRTSYLRVALWSIIGGAFFLASLNLYKYMSGEYANNFGGFAQSGVSFMVDDAKHYRISGIMPGPNFFAQMLLIAIPLSIERMLSESNRLLKITAGLAFATTLCVIVLTFSRGAMFGLFILMIIAILFIRLQPRWLLLGALLAIIAIPLLPSAYVHRISSTIPMIGMQENNSVTADASVRGRLGEMLVAWEMFLDHPLMGVGINNYEVYFQKYTIELDQMPRGQARPAHSLYLEIAAEGGLLGVGAFGLLFLYLGRICVRGYRSFIEIGEASNANMVAGLAMSFTGYLIAAIFLHDAYPRYFWLLAGLVMSIPGILRNTKPEKAI